MAMRKERWREELAAAATEKDVINVVRDYVALLTSDDVAAMPGGSRPGLIATTEQIAEWAVKLVREQLALVAASEGVEVMRDMCEFFAAAAGKVTQIRIASVARPSEG
jgi:hypothetical protein